MIRVLTVFLLIFALAPDSLAQVIDQARGVDPNVSYPSLASIGPWDDRNYAVNSEDLLLLSENEAELSESIPVFYRVLLRKLMPDLQRTGPVQYPRSALPRFLIEFGGFLVDGSLYKRVERKGNTYELVFEDSTPLQEFQKARAATSEFKVTSPTGAAESAVAIKPTDTDIVVAGTNGPGSGQQMHYSVDGGVTWTPAAALPLGGTCCDPTIAWSSDGSLVYTATLGSGVWVYRSSDDGQTWDDFETDTPGDPRRELGTPSSDKEYLHVDTYSGSPHRDNVYLTWHQGNIMQFARSVDSGNTWASQAFSSASDDRGIGSDITTDKSGNVYYIWPAFNSQKIYVRKSTDGGVSFDPKIEIADTEASFDFAIPSMETRRVFVYVSAATDTTNGFYGGSLYAAWTDATAPTSGTAANNHGRIQVAYSRDSGATWSVVTPHETLDANIVDRWHQWLTVSADGTVHVVFYDTRNDLTRASVDFYHSQSSDGGQTFTIPERITSESSPNISDSFEFGDYNGADVVLNDVISVYTDNRDESGGSGQSVDVYAAIIQPSALPVDFVSVEALVDGADVILRWATDSESDNSGFEIERKAGEKREYLGFVSGMGTSTSRVNYEYRIADPGPGKHVFQLKQVGSDGTYSYSPEIELDVELVAGYQLSSPYPNPFAETARVEFAVRDAQLVTLDVIDMLGRTVSVLFSGEMSPNVRESFELDASELASGTYFVRATGKDFVTTKKITLVR
ncbi:MAG: T9SS type A sorting domain-containing protein [Rhodothermales bacterium]|nr:T9SS type A sorting domain-containing protein [Rhodothermales bacterium]